MNSLITLHLLAPNNTLEHVRALPVLRDLPVDIDYGLVTISPRRNLYVVRVEGEVDRDALLAVPAVKGIHGDVRISSTRTDQED